MLAFAWFWPHDQILIWGIIPIEARWMVALMTGLALFGGFTGAQGGIAHFAHLGGFVGGWICLKAFGARPIVDAARFNRVWQESVYTLKDAYEMKS